MAVKRTITLLDRRAQKKSPLAMAAIVKSQAIEMLCGSTESSVQLAGGVMRAEGPSREIIPTLAGVWQYRAVFSEE